MLLYCCTQELNQLGLCFAAMLLYQGADPKESLFCWCTAVPRSTANGVSVLQVYCCTQGLNRLGYCLAAMLLYQVAQSIESLSCCTKKLIQEVSVLLVYCCSQEHSQWILCPAGVLLYPGAQPSGSLSCCYAAVLRGTANEVSVLRRCTAVPRGSNNGVFICLF